LSYRTSWLLVETGPSPALIGFSQQVLSFIYRVGWLVTQQIYHQPVSHWRSAEKADTIFLIGQRYYRTYMHL